jgi:hypothetical protein
MNIIEAIDDSNLLGASIRDPGSFKPWKALLAAAFGLELPAFPLPGLYRPPCTARRARRVLVACDRRQAKILHRYCQGILSPPLLDSHVLNVTATRAGLLSRSLLAVGRDKQHNGSLTRTEVLAPVTEGRQKDSGQTHGKGLAATRSYRTVRGRSVCVAVLDELAFWRDDDSANPDSEVLNAVRASMATFGSDAMVIAGSSPYAKRGVLWDAFRRWFGKDDARNLVWRAGTRIMNPTVPGDFIDSELERDPVSANSEYFAEFRSDIAAFVDLAVLEACTAEGVFEIAPLSDIQYIAFVDPSGGSSDSFTLAIAHREPDGVLVLDCLRETRAPFQPECVVADFCQTLKSYRVGRVHGDRYAGSWPREQFGTVGRSRKTDGLRRA